MSFFSNWPPSISIIKLLQHGYQEQGVNTYITNLLCHRDKCLHFLVYQGHVLNLGYI